MFRMTRLLMIDLKMTLRFDDSDLKRRLMFVVRKVTAPQPLVSRVGEGTVPVKLWPPEVLSMFPDNAADIFNRLFSVFLQVEVRRGPTAACIRGSRGTGVTLGPPLAHHRVPSRLVDIL